MSPKSMGVAIPNEKNVWPIGKKSAFFSLSIIMLLGILDFADRQVLAALFPYLKAEYALSDTQLGLLVSVVNISMAILVIPSGYFIDKWSRTKMIALMAFTWSFATGLCAFAGSFIHLFIARFFVGAGEAGYNPAGQSLLAASFPQRLRTTAIACLQFSMSAGALIGLMAGAYIAEKWGWRYAFGLVAIPGLIISFIALFMKDFKNVKSVDPTEEIAQEPYWKVCLAVLRTPTLLCVFFAQACVCLVTGTFINWLPSYFSREAGLPMLTASSLSAVYMMGTMVATLLSGPFLDWMRHKRLTLALSWQTVACFIAFGLIYTVFALTTPGSALQVGLLVASNFFWGTLITLTFTITADLSLPNQRGTAIGLLISIQNILGLGLGPLLTGILSDRFNLSTALLILSSFFAVAGLLYAGARFFYPRDLAKMKEVQLEF